MKYRRKDIVVEAEQYVQDNLDVILPFISGSSWTRPTFRQSTGTPTGLDPLVIQQDKSTLVLNPNEWLVIYSCGRMTVLSDKLFREVYVPLERCI